MTKAVLFDMDGVLLDTERVAFASWEQAADERGVADIRSLYRQCVGMNTDNHSEVFLPPARVLCER